MENEKLVSILEDVRNSQRQLLEEYRRVANEALALQKQSFEVQQRAVAQQSIAVDAQAKHLRLYRGVLVVAVPMLVFMLWFVAKNW